jgi:hypothetical protein
MHVEVVISVVSVPISVYACLSPPPKWATTKATSNGLFHAGIYIEKKGVARCMVIILVRDLIYLLTLQTVQTMPSPPPCLGILCLDKQTHAIRQLVVKSSSGLQLFHYEETIRYAIHLYQEIQSVKFSQIWSYIHFYYSSGWH